MSTAKQLPDPTQEQAEWLLQIHTLPDMFNLHDYRALGRLQKKGRLWTIESGQRINSGLNNGTIRVEMLTVEGRRINHFAMTDAAKQFWVTGATEGQSADDILKGWDALQSILGDSEKSDE